MADGNNMHARIATVADRTPGRTGAAVNRGKSKDMVRLLEQEQSGIVLKGKMAFGNKIAFENWMRRLCEASHIILMGGRSGKRAQVVKNCQKKTGAGCNCARFRAQDCFYCCCGAAD
jgi:hypothetical protein